MTTVAVGDELEEQRALPEMTHSRAYFTAWAVAMISIPLACKIVKTNKI